jgi:hypothetical protein
MKTFPLGADGASLAVTETGGHLSDVTFTLAGGKKVRPMHTAPWEKEELAPGTPNVLRMLRGDFFCAPFGSDGADPNDPNSTHGLPANGTWSVTKLTPTTLDATLEGTVMGATVTKRVEVRPRENVVYQRHVMTGGAGRLPVGQHAMVHAETPLQLAFAPFTMALTPPVPFEVPPEGRQLLAEDQVITDITRAKRVDGGTADLSVFPTAPGFESLWMAVTDRNLPFGWTTATAAEEGWVWFGLKNVRELPETVIWISDGGRDYAPWNGRHRRCIGLEDICGYFHLGTRRSVADNPVAASGSPTAVTLGEKPVSISYVFGVAATPAGFGRVTEVAKAPGGITLIDAGGRKASAAVDLSFIGA